MTVLYPQLTEKGKKQKRQRDCLNGQGSFPDGVKGNTLMKLECYILKLAMKVLSPYHITSSAFLFQDHPIVTAGICLVKSTLAGFLAGVVFRAVEKKNSLVATITASAVTPVVNTGVFVLGCLVIMGTIEGYVGAVGLDVSGVYFIFVMCAGINFLFEFLVNMLFASALHRVYKAILAKLGASK